MKLKQTPDDFVVEELTDVLPSSGPFALYRLQKSNWTTTDAIAELVRQWRLAPKQVAFGGLKDRHAKTTQHLTIQNGPKKSWSSRDLLLTYVGQIENSFQTENISANRFTITMRNLKKSEAALALHRVKDVQETGLPNYYDDQRFGSVTSSEYPARLMVLGRYEDALKLILTAPYEHDKAAAKRKKELVRHNWGRWRNCLRAFGKDSDRRVFQHLAINPHDFRGAVARLRPELQGLYLAAYQSLIWNRMLANCIRQYCIEQLAFIRLKTGNMPVPLEFDEDGSQELLRQSIPLPSARLAEDPNAAWAPWVKSALENQGHTLHEMKLPGLRKPFFSKGNRAAFVVPANLTAKSGDDDKHPTFSKLTLRFELPRGSYATILVKRLTQIRRTDNMSSSTND